MDIIIIVVAILALVGLVVVMFRYAGFIHQGPSADKRDKKQRGDETDNPPNKGHE